MLQAEASHSYPTLQKQNHVEAIPRIPQKCVGSNLSAEHFLYSKRVYLDNFLSADASFQLQRYEELVLYCTTVNIQQMKMQRFMV